MAAAADLKFALPEAITAFEKKRPDLKVEATYAASGALFAQLMNGAPFDLFLSADVDYPTKLIESGTAAKESLFRYAEGRLAIWVRRESPLDLEKSGISALLDPAVKKIAIANPRHSPYGRAATAALKQAGVYDALVERLVFGENVAQAAQFVESGSADAGLVALSLASSPAMSEKGRWTLAPRELHPPLEQAGAIMTGAREREGAAALRVFLTGPEGQEALKRRGLGAKEP